MSIRANSRRANLLRASPSAFLAAAGLALAAFALQATPAAAYEFTGTFPGGNCRAMATKASASNIWYGHFTGRRQSPWNMDFIEGKTVEGCFTSKAQCENWLYQWRSAWQFNFWNDYCSKGYPPPAQGWRPRSG